jgi:hypothetical protein
MKQLEQESLQAYVKTLACKNYYLICVYTSRYCKCLQPLLLVQSEVLLVVFYVCSTAVSRALLACLIRIVYDDR